MIFLDTNSIKKLRNITGAGILMCKEALIKSNGNIEQAIDIIRILGKSISTKKSINSTNFGAIFIKTNKTKKIGVMLELCCETDFVSNNINFIELGNIIISIMLQHNTDDIDFIRNKSDNYINSLVLQVNENITIKKTSIVYGDIVSYYLHSNKKIGVLLSIKTSNFNNIKLPKMLAMHIAAYNPKYISDNDIPISILNKEYKIQYNIAKKYDKPINIVKRIIDNKMLQFKKDLSLLNQIIINNDSKIIKDLINENNYTINNFIRFEIGNN
ncbi:MAG: translation elongation factor Ts [Candidatus Lightella neohaematopini]|nr:translation elongation factor Ts [Candidatus Lightella neohaematopini]MCV2528939.1 translation elongation factor Ts [Candidatus Lightella neohaematopini]